MSAPPFDLFVSYSRSDNAPTAQHHRGPVQALVDAIAAEFQRTSGRPLRVFMDCREIHSMDDWGDVIRSALATAPVMLATLSPRYLDSWYCRKEWRIFVEHEVRRGMFGRNVLPCLRRQVRRDSKPNTDRTVGMSSRPRVGKLNERRIPCSRMVPCVACAG